MTLSLEFDKSTAEQLKHAAEKHSVPIKKFAVQLIKAQLPAAQRREQALAEIQSWIDAAKKSKARGSDDFLLAIDEDRMSKRKLFPPELKGITW